jgi:hypothetical protein
LNMLLAYQNESDAFRCATRPFILDYPRANSAYFCEKSTFQHFS